MNGVAIAAVAVAGLWWLGRHKRQPNKPGCGCPRSIIDAAEPHLGTDCTGSWWQRLHGADLMHPHFGNYSGVSPDPGSINKIQIAAELNIGWNGDIR